MSKARIHCFVSGRVQGVFFRASTQREGARLGLEGWVKNLPDGRVEIMASGAEDSLRCLASWLQVGPPHASVKDLSVQWLDYRALDPFRVV